MSLTDGQAAILQRAVEHPDGISLPPATLPPAPRGAVAKALLKAGLLGLVDGEGPEPSVAWNLDGRWWSCASLTPAQRDRRPGDGRGACGAWRGPGGRR
ncbi:MAG TPA: hypothetical protein VE684_13275 [Crenalkalicoccus sp.]|nr:hypothetical protein [Crenalkalicoccus sp.]